MRDLKEIVKDIREDLFALQDLTYKEFHKKLIPNVDEHLIIGIRTPVLRKYAKSLDKEEREAFLQALPHVYYEENNLHGFLLEQEKDYQQCIERLNVFLPHVDNWATCDMINPKILGKNINALDEQIREWLKSDSVYTVRYGLKLRMNYFLEADFQADYLQEAINCCCQEYYINMMVAWYMATALAKQYDTTVEVLREHRLPEWVHRKTIQKAIESYRITDSQKAYLRGLR